MVKSRRAESSRRFGDDGGTDGRGKRPGPVGGAVVHDDRPEAGRHRGQKVVQRGGFVEDWDDDIGHVSVSNPRVPYGPMPKRSQFDELVRPRGTLSPRRDKMVGCWMHHPRPRAS